jgi:hypothetical protein
MSIYLEDQEFHLANIFPASYGTVFPHHGMARPQDVDTYGE